MDPYQIKVLDFDSFFVKEPLVNLVHLLPGKITRELVQKDSAARDVGCADFGQVVLERSQKELRIPFCSATQ